LLLTEGSVFQMSKTYQELLQKTYIQALRNQKDGNSILTKLEEISTDYLTNENPNQLEEPSDLVTEIESLDFFDEVNEYEELVTSF